MNNLITRLVLGLPISALMYFTWFNGWEAFVFGMLGMTVAYTILAD